MLWGSGLGGVRVAALVMYIYVEGYRPVWLVALATTQTWRLLAGGKVGGVWGVGKNRGLRVLRTIRHPTRGGDVASRLGCSRLYYSATWGRGCNRFRGIAMGHATGFLWVFGSWALLVLCPPPDNRWYQDTKGCWWMVGLNGQWCWLWGVWDVVDE